MSVYKLFLKPVRGKEDFVYIYLYNLPTSHKQPILTSLKLRVPRKYCIESKNTLKRISKEIPKDILNKLGFSSVDLLNAYLNEKLENFIISNGSKEFVPKENKTLNDWFDIIISRQSNQGTKMRYRNVKHLLEQFQRFRSVKLGRDKTDKIYFRNLDVDFLTEFRNYLLTEPNENENRKQNTLNSANYKLKALKAIINKAHFEKHYTFNINPFEFISFSFQEKSVEVLTKDELKRIIETKYIEVLRRTARTKEGVNLFGHQIEEGVEERNKKNRRYTSKHSLEDIRNYFLFQLMSQGIRISDLITLRWSHFKNSGSLRIVKIMVKTKQEIKVLVNEKMTAIIGRYIVRYSEFLKEEIELLNELNNKINHLYDLLNDGFYILLDNSDSNLSKFKPIINQLSIEYIQQPLYKINLESIELLSKELQNNKKPKKPTPIPDKSTDITIKNIYDWFYEEKQKYRDQNLSKFKNYKNQRHEIVCKMIEKLAFNESLKDDFVFTLLDKKDFLNIANDDFSRLDEPQYKKFQSIRTYINKLLKLIAKQAGINKRLTSHLARHSYTSLMVDLGENINLFDVMTSLGHKHITTTQTYLKRFDNKKIDNLNLIISENLDSGININI